MCEWSDVTIALAMYGPTDGWMERGEWVGGRDWELKGITTERVVYVDNQRERERERERERFKTRKRLRCYEKRVESITFMIIQKRPGLH